MEKEPKLPSPEQVDHEPDQSADKNDRFEKIKQKLSDMHIEIGGGVIVETKTDFVGYGRPAYPMQYKGISSNGSGFIFKVYGRDATAWKDGAPDLELTESDIIDIYPDNRPQMN
jgi:hypothetical protein